MLCKIPQDIIKHIGQYRNALKGAGTALFMFLFHVFNVEIRLNLTRKSNTRELKAVIMHDGHYLPINQVRSAS